MTDMSEYSKKYQQFIAALTAPGQPFEIVERHVGGRRYRMYKNAPATIAEALDAGRQYGEAPFMQYQGATTSFDAFFATADALASGLANECGIRPGDAVAIAMRNRPEWAIAYAAIIYAGAVAVPINSWGQSRELGQALRNCQARLAFVDAQRHGHIADQLDEMALDAVVVDGDAGPRTRRWDELLERVAGRPRPPIDIDGESVGMILYTSGATGRPKGVVSRHRQMTQAIFNFEATGAATGAVNADLLANVMADGKPFSHLLAVPLFHVSGLHAALFNNLRAGRKMVIMYKWDPEEALALIASERVGLLGVSPSMLMDLLHHPAYATTDTSSLFSLGSGGSALPSRLPALIEEKAPGRLAGCGYGATETNACGCSMNGNLFNERPRSTGLVAPIMEMELRDEQGRPVAASERGEVWFYGPTVADGYRDAPEATAQAFHDGWFRSGDVGRIDEDGYVHVVDRIKDMVVRGGENIDSQEVEAALYQCPDVLEAAAYGVPHEALGEELAASVRLRPDSRMDAEALRASLKGQLAHYKIPAHVHLSEEPLPRNPVGKTLKAPLAKAMTQRLGREDLAT